MDEGSRGGSYGVPQGGPRERSLAGLSETERDLALERYRILRPFLRDGAPLGSLAEEHGISVRTLRRWAKSYEDRGLAGLVRKRRGDRGKSRMQEDMRRVVEALYLAKPRRSVAAIHREAAEVAARQGWPPPGYEQVRAVVGALSPSLVSMAHEGTDAYRQAYDLLHRREASRPNEIWQADHTQLDVWLKRDRGEKGKPRKPWLTVIEDDHSRALAGYCLGFDAPSAIGTALALRQAIWRKSEARWQVCGIPETFYTDHGPDFTSRHIEQVAADIEMGLVFSTKGQPRGRGKIERFFRTVDQLLLPTVEGYAPEGSGPARPVLTLPALDARFRRWLLDVYHQRTHGETGQAPEERWRAGGFLPRMPDSLQRLDLLLLSVAKERRVWRDGIRFEGFRYLCPTLAAYVGEGVTIRYDPRDMAEIRVYHEGSFLCRALCPELAGEEVSLKEVTGARNKRRRELRAELKDRAAAVEELLALHRHEITPNEQPTGERGDEPPQPHRRTESIAGKRLKRYRNE